MSLLLALIPVAMGDPADKPRVGDDGRFTSAVVSLGGLGGTQQEYLAPHAQIGLGVRTTTPYGVAGVDLLYHEDLPSWPMQGSGETLRVRWDGNGWQDTLYGLYLGASAAARHTHWTWSLGDFGSKVDDESWFVDVGGNVGARLILQPGVLVELGYGLAVPIPTSGIPFGLSTGAQLGIGYAWGSARPGELRAWRDANGRGTRYWTASNLQTLDRQSLWVKRYRLQQTRLVASGFVGGGLTWVSAWMLWAAAEQDQLATLAALMLASPGMACALGGGVGMTYTELRLGPVRRAMRATESAP